MKIYTGTSGYSYNEWKGTFYPQKISANEMLSYYSKRLNTVEINNTFYRMPKESAVKTWADKVGSEFVFAVKAPQVITHIKRLIYVREETQYFLRQLAGLGKQLGPVLFQFPASFRENHGLLEEFLEILPAKTCFAFEFRSATWFNEATFGLLRKKKCCLCLADTDKNPLHEIISTASWGYLRLRRTDYDEPALSRWAQKILSQKWRKAFVFFKHEEEQASKGPEWAVRFREIIGGS